MIDVATPLIQIDSLEKQFGRRTVLNKLSLEISRHRVTAIVGHNSSGKTTLIKTILGLTKPTDGRIFFDGHKLNGSWSYRDHIGYMPQTARFPENLTARDLLVMLKDLRGNVATLDESLIEAFSLDTELDQPLRTLSGGTRQKVSAVLAFLFDPACIILDEPTAGLDPIASGVLKDKILAERERGKTFILTSHIISEIEALADDIAFLMDGNVHVSGKMEAIKALAGHDDLERAIAQLMREAAA